MTKYEQAAAAANKFFENASPEQVLAKLKQAAPQLFSSQETPPAVAAAPTKK